MKREARTIKHYGINQRSQSFSEGHLKFEVNEKKKISCMTVLPCLHVHGAAGGDPGVYPRSAPNYLSNVPQSLRRTLFKEPLCRETMEMQKRSVIASKDVAPSQKARLPDNSSQRHCVMNDFALRLSLPNRQICVHLDGRRIYAQCVVVEDQAR